jgi:hypothetical protein
MSLSIFREMKISPKDIQETSMKLLETLQNSSFRSRFSHAWTRHQEFLVAAIAGLIIGLIVVFMILR